MALGIRWGLGHSTGLVIVAIIFIVLKGEVDMRHISHYLNIFVGVFMIALGLHGIYSAVYAKYFETDNKYKKYQSIGNDHDDFEKEGLLGASVEDASKEAQFAQNNVAIDIDADLTEHREDCSCCSSCCPSCTADIKDPVTQGIVAFGVGILHGIAGPGGILGVLPAVEMKDWTAAVVYLACFVTSSTLCMGTFAAVYGEMTKKIGDISGSVEFIVTLISCSLSLIVGILWVVLSYMGKLEEFFED